MRPRFRRNYRRAGETFAARLAKEWGPPDYADALVRVWDLERLRWRREGKPPSQAGGTWRLWSTDGTRAGTRELTLASVEDTGAF